jgi:hypothetical protein
MVGSGDFVYPKGEKHAVMILAHSLKEPKDV